jgi:DNA modification methylase
MTRVDLFVGDCRELLKPAPENSVDAVVTDPPYGLGFMGKGWDHGVPGIDFWREVLRVAKPGANLLAFGGSRTYHRLATAIEDAGFEIRDCLSWLYGTGFPKSLNLGDGIGTALKPGWEPIILARKPLIGTVAANVAAFGCGGINVDGCRLEYTSDADKASATPQGACTAASAGAVPNVDGCERSEFTRPEQIGRWPANVVLDEEAAASLDTQTGGASRFYYCAKASRSERDAGLEAFRLRSGGEATEREDGSAGTKSPRAGAGRTSGARNYHPTVKPVALMRWLVRLATPKGGVVLDPFMGSGSTGIAAKLEGFDFVGLDLDPDYVAIAQARIARAGE